MRIPKTLRSVALFIVLTVGFASAQENTAVDQAIVFIFKVQHTLASQLDAALPQTPFEQWVRLQVGNEAEVGWVVRTAEGYPTLAEVDISMGGRPGLVIMVACTKPDFGARRVPKFESLRLIRKEEYDEWRCLQ